MSLLLVILGGTLTVLENAQTNFTREASRSSSNDNVRLAVESLDREVRSGNVLYDPTTENYSAGDVAPGYSVRVYTQSDFPTRGEARCIQWRVTSDGKLQTRNWSKNWQNSPSTLVTGWRTVASGITNRKDGVPAFSLPSGVTNLLNVDIRADDDSTLGATVEVKEAVSGRNAVFYPGNQDCGPVTPDPSLSGVGGSKVPPY